MANVLDICAILKRRVHYNPVKLAEIAVLFQEITLNYFSDPPLAAISVTQDLSKPDIKFNSLSLYPLPR